MRRDPPPIVLDSSVALAFLLEEADSRAVRARVRAWVDQGERFAVPSLFWLEVVNVLGHVRALSGKIVLESLYHLDDLGITTVEPDRVQLLLTLSRVEQHSITAYDASYLALAHSVSAKLATLDAALAAAAGRRYVDPRGGDPTHRTGEELATYESEGTWPEFAQASAFLARLRADAQRTIAEAQRR
jgi:predicted nucleic acid-binding protein